jgi:hypothetical protein
VIEARARELDQREGDAAHGEGSAGMRPGPKEHDTTISLLNMIVKVFSAQLPAGSIRDNRHLRD